MTEAIIINPVDSRRTMSFKLGYALVYQYGHYAMRYDRAIDFIISMVDLVVDIVSCSFIASSGSIHAYHY